MTDSTISADAVLKGLEFLRDMYGPTAVDPAMQKPVRDAITLIQHQSAELEALRAQAQANAVMAGRICVKEEGDDPDYTTSLGLLLIFRTREEVRAALKDGRVRFAFGQYPDESATPQEKADAPNTGN